MVARQGGNDGKQRQETAAYKAQYARRAGMEGSRRCGLRRTRYMGLAKTHLQHLLTAVALNGNCSGGGALR